MILPSWSSAGTWPLGLIALYQSECWSQFAALINLLSKGMPRS